MVVHRTLHTNTTYIYRSNVCIIIIIIIIPKIIIFTIIVFVWNQPDIKYWPTYFHLHHASVQVRPAVRATHRVLFLAATVFATRSVGPQTLCGVVCYGYACSAHTWYKPEQSVSIICYQQAAEHFHRKDVDDGNNNNNDSNNKGNSSNNKTTAVFHLCRKSSFSARTRSDRLHHPNRTPVPRNSPEDIFWGMWNPWLRIRLQ